MSVVTEQMVAPKYVQILMEVSFVDVTLGFSWIMMGLHVMVCRRNNYNIYIRIYSNTYFIIYMTHIYIYIYIYNPCDSSPEGMCVLCNNAICINTLYYVFSKWKLESS